VIPFCKEFDMKRAADIFLSILLLVFLSPVLLAIALGVKWSSPGPVLSAQRRTGPDGEEIVSYKFRTRTVHLQGWSGARVTRFGAFLRRTSLDEAPHLWNVLEGSMSLVGRAAARRAPSEAGYA
jgi:putative colanic acid biosynthesis UDP-glucose lipid carrier transferase